MEGRDTSPIPPSPNYGFAILSPLEWVWRALSPSFRRPTCYTVGRDRGKALEKAEQPPTLCLGPGQTSGALSPRITPPQLLPAMGLLRLKPVTQK